MFFQTRLHEDICVKRQVATIATHDLEKIKGPLLYDAMEPKKIMVLSLDVASSAESDQLLFTCFVCHVTFFSNYFVNFETQMIGITD